MPGSKTIITWCDRFSCFMTSCTLQCIWYGQSNILWSKGCLWAGHGLSDLWVWSKCLWVGLRCLWYNIKLEHCTCTVPLYRERYSWAVNLSLGFSWVMWRTILCRKLDNKVASLLFQPNNLRINMFQNTPFVNPWDDYIIRTLAVQEEVRQDHVILLRTRSVNKT